MRYTLLGALLIFVVAIGHANGSTVIRYTALGDSVTWQGGYVDAYAQHLEADLGPVDVDNRGVPFWFSIDLATALSSDSELRASVASADVVSVFIGLNDYQFVRAQYLDPNSVWCPPPKDICMPGMVADFLTNWNAIMDEIQTLNPYAAVRTITIYNPFVADDLASGDFAYLNPFLEQMNAAIGGADVHAIFNGPNGDQPPDSYLADELHPNAVGHQAIADALRDLGYDDIDGDGDGCTNGQEAGSDPELGGMRDPAFEWDFYDVNGSRKIDAVDVALVRAHYDPIGPVLVTTYDRSNGVHPWAPGIPDEKINGVDIALVRVSFNHDCS